jgi:pseudouridine-5'-phosphate glycosidase
MIEQLCTMSLKDRIVYSDEVAKAIQSGQPVVALESTIVAHGMPYPQNLHTALAVEEIVRNEGAIPATIAIIGGKIHAGLSREMLDSLAQSGKSAGKVSRRDMAAYLANPSLIGATTVASTMIAADHAGISVFVTGGIGGVHRGAESSWDVSADLIEFTRSPVTVISAGAKAILDLPKTLEYLETFGVPVIGFNTREFPAFYSRESGLPLEWSVNEVSELAAGIRAHRLVDPHGGVLVVNPISSDAEIPRSEIEPVIGRCVNEAAALGISGKALTPFLLKRIAEVTAGRSLNANIALVKNNAQLGARLACTL